MHVVKLPDSLSRLLSTRKPTLLVEASQGRAVLLPIDEYERLRAVYDWHERMLRGA
jgi:PHD/YefM family antitoxin component YafN of YafNO toxin-antitoxin module